MSSGEKTPACSAWTPLSSHTQKMALAPVAPNPKSASHLEGRAYTERNATKPCPPPCTRKKKGKTHLVEDATRTGKPKEKPQRKKGQRVSPLKQTPETLKAAPQKKPLFLHQTPNGLSQFQEETWRPPKSAKETLMECEVRMNGIVPPASNK